MLAVTPLLVRAQLALKLTQEGLGELAGVSRRTVTRWTNGGAPSDGQLANIVRELLDVDLELANALAARDRHSKEGMTRCLRLDENVAACSPELGHPRPPKLSCLPGCPRCRPLTGCW